MKTILRGAIIPALIVAVLQFVIELILPLAAFGRPFKQQISLAYTMMVLSQVAVLLGAAAYAGFLRRRSGAGLAACAVGGAVVGLLANLASQVAKSAILCLMLAVMFLQVPAVNGLVWLAIPGVLALSCLLAGIGGLIAGEVGGGAVGLLSLWQRRTIRPNGRIS